MTRQSTTKDDSQIEFVTHHRDDVIGILSGFDRLRILGSLRCLNHVPGMMGYLSRMNVLLKCFKAHVLQMSSRVKAATEALSRRCARPIEYLRFRGEVLSDIFVLRIAGRKRGRLDSPLVFIRVHSWLAC